MQYIEECHGKENQFLENNGSNNSQFGTSTSRSPNDGRRSPSKSPLNQSFSRDRKGSGEMETLKAQLADKEFEMNFLEVQHQALQKRIENQDRELESLDSERHELIDTIIDHKCRIENMEMTNKTLREILQTMSTELHGERTKTQQLHKIVEAARQEKIQLEQRVSALTERCERRDDENQKLRAKLSFGFTRGGSGNTKNFWTKNFKKNQFRQQQQFQRCNDFFWSGSGFKKSNMNKENEPPLSETLH